jgi:hypothetical protein
MVSSGSPEATIPVRLTFNLAFFPHPFRQVKIQMIEKNV